MGSQHMPLYKYIPETADSGGIFKYHQAANRWITPE